MINTNGKEVGNKQMINVIAMYNTQKLNRVVHMYEDIKLSENEEDVA